MCPRLLGFVLLVALAGACSRERQKAATMVTMPGPRPPVESPLPEANLRCERCHKAIAEEWRSSSHHLAATNAQYRAAYAVEPFAFCQACHAPGARNAETAGPLAELGIGCLNCHPPIEGAPLTGTSHHPLVSLSHAVVRSQDYSQTGACAQCHEFEFPSKGRDQPAFMQRTDTEHARSPFSATGCADCHMPIVGSFGARHRSHAFASTRDSLRLRDAVTIEAVRRDQTLEFSIAPRHVGHAWPTGDLFRRITVEARARDQAGTVKAVRRRYLSRHFERQRQSNGGLALVEVADDRPGAECVTGGCTVRFVLDLGVTARNLPLEFDVAYERVQHLRGSSEDLAEVAERVVLAEGVR